AATSSATIIGGDYNAVPNPQIDRFPISNISRPESKIFTEL
ncbi:728_t:CDS:1, partial [Entrophospora sp. SA101]